MMKSKCGAKFILGGEHFVVYGSSAIVLPLNELQSEVSYIPGDSLSFEGFDENYIRKAVEICCEKLEIKSTPLGHYHAQTDIPIGAGLGSSASFAVALTKCLLKIQNKGGPDTLLFDRATSALEAMAHGNASGIDLAAVKYQTPIWFRKDIPPVSLTIKGKWTFILADTGEKTSTRQAIEKFATNFHPGSRDFATILLKVNKIMDTMRDSLSIKDYIHVGECMDQLQSFLEQGGVCSQKNKDFCQIALDNGALGAKITGAGLGGMIVALIPTDENTVLDSVLSALKKHGATFLSTVGLKDTNLLGAK